jgi:hypothetical protein
MNALETSQISTLCQGHHTYFDCSPSTPKKSISPSSPSFGESLATSNQKYKRNRKRKNKNHKSPTYAIHVGDISPTSTSHARGKKPTCASHVGSISSITASNIGKK